MKSLADFANRVQDHLKHRPLSEDDVMSMFDYVKYIYDVFTESYDSEDDSNGMYLEFEVIVDVHSFLTSNDLLKSTIIGSYDNDNYRGILTNSGGYCSYIRISVIKVHFKSTDISELERDFKAIEDAKGNEHRELVTDFLKTHIDFEKTIAELRNEENMWGEKVYLTERSTSEYDESTFDEMLKVLNIYDRKQKITELLTN